MNKKWIKLQCIGVVGIILFSGCGADGSLECKKGMTKIPAVIAVDTEKIKSQIEYAKQLSEEKATPAKEEDIVKIKDYIPDIQIDLKYASDENFTGQTIYTFHDAYLRYGTIKKLMNVQEQLQKEGMTLVIWDAFRPVEAQFVLYDVCPNSVYVANPYNGYSNHSRGNTVDLTIGYKDGKLMTMPTGFDDFTLKADRDYTDCNDEERANALFLENIMKSAGFIPYSGEWWHFADEQSYDVATDISMDALK